MKKTTLSNIAASIQMLPKTEQSEVNGGILLCCEEKRRSFLGISYTSMQWTVVNDGSIFISIRM